MINLVALVAASFSGGVCWLSTIRLAGDGHLDLAIITGTFVVLNAVFVYLNASVVWRWNRGS